MRSVVRCREPLDHGDVAGEFGLNVPVLDTQN